MNNPNKVCPAPADDILSDLVAEAAMGFASYPAIVRVLAPLAV